MQADKITKKILEDASEKANSIVEEAKNQSRLTLNKAKDFVKTQQKEVLNKIEDFKVSVADKYNTMLKIEGNKILLQSKQVVLKKVKQNAVEHLTNLSKDDLLKFLTELIKKYAEKGETLNFCFKNLTAEDISSLKCVKDLNLTAKKVNLKEQGLVLSSENCDKNLLFSSLVEAAFEDNENEINKLLF